MKTIVFIELRPFFIRLFFEKQSLSTILNERSSLTIVNEGLSLTIIGEMTNFIKTGVYGKKLHATLLNVGDLKLLDIFLKITQ